MKYQRKTKPAIWITAFPGQRTIVIAKPKRRLGMSIKRQAEGKVYKQERAQFLLIRPHCERCSMPSVCVHHWAGRRSNFLRQETWRASCVPCNDFAKQHPAEARAEDWIAPVGVYLT